MKPVKDLTHDDLGLLAINKLKAMGYIASFANVASAAAGEQPDAIGIKSCGSSFLVESKVSRSDFFADQKKPWRRNNHEALGSFRAYIAPEGLLKSQEIPYGWQLWEVYGKNKPYIRIVKGYGKVERVNPFNGRTEKIGGIVGMDSDEYYHFGNKSSARKALGLMATIISRIEAEGIDVQEFASRNGKGFLKR